MRKIKIGYFCADVNPNKTKSFGIYNVTKEVLRQLLKINNFEVVLILSEESKTFFKEFNCKKKICKTNKLSPLNKFFFYPNFANRVAKEDNLEVLFFPKGHIPFKKVKGVLYISIIHDLIPFYYLKKGKISMLPISFLLWWSAKKSDFIFTDSEFSKKEIEKITRKPITTIPLGYVQPNKTKKPKIKRPYVFIIGNKNPHKNLDLSIRLIEEYNKRFNKKYNVVTSDGSLTESELAGLYKYANFSIFLSNIEGFGLPFIESYYWKTPVVFNNKTALAELGKGLPGACDVNDKESVFRAIRMVENLKKDEINKISNFLKEKYNWEKCREEIMFKLLVFIRFY